MKHACAFREAIVVALALLAVPNAVVAQLELGVDVGYTRTSLDQGSATDLVAHRFDLRPDYLRLGLPISDRLLFEAGVSAGRGSVSGHGGEVDNSGWSFTLMPSVAWLFGEARSIRPYLRVAGGVSRYGGSEVDSFTRWSAAGGGGLRIPLTDAVTGRIEGLFTRISEGGLNSTEHRIRLTTGFSARIR